MKDKLIAFFKNNIWQIVFDLVLFLVAVGVIVAPQTHLYFEITHFGQIQKVVDHMQSTNDNYGQVGLNKEIKTILSN